MEPYLTLAYLELWYIQYLRNIQNHWCSVFLMNPDIFRTLIYPQLLCILRSKHVRNPAEYLRWRILLRTLCNYIKFRCPIYSKLLRIQNQSVSATPLCISYTLYLKNEEKCLSLPPSCWYWSTASAQVGVQFTGKCKSRIVFFSECNWFSFL